MPPLFQMLEKRILLLILLVILLLIFIPVVIAATNGHVSEGQTKEDTQTKEINPLSTSIKVYDTKQKKAVTMDLEEYVLRVTAAEMPASYGLEALKAQACAARTFTVKRMEGTSSHPDGAKVCTDSKHCQAYISPENMKSHWGAEYLTKYKKVKQAVDETSGKIIVYKGEPITALYFSTSGGYTENSEDVFASAKPYLRSVKSDGEEPYAPRFYGKVKVPFTDFVSKLQGFSKSIDVSKSNIQGSVGNIVRTDTGRVKTIQIGGKSLTGRDVRGIFNLNSTNFKISYTDDQVVFDTIGYGHGVGMSQTGADAMAIKGSTYEEILKHYYTGVDIVNMGNIK